MFIKLPKRKPIRLSGFDYSKNGYYFITICTQDRKCLFGDIIDNKMVLNDVGKIINNVWNSLPEHHPVELDTFQIMPNHIHLNVGVLRAKPSPVVRAQPVIPNIQNDSGIARDNSGIARNAPTGFGHVMAGSLSCIIRSFKSETTKQIRRLIENSNLIIWQRNYYERIIRDEFELYKIREYINSNPLMWNRDRNNPTGLKI